MIPLLLLLFIGTFAFMFLWHLIASFVRAGRELRESIQDDKERRAQEAAKL